MHKSGIIPRRDRLRFDDGQRKRLRGLRLLPEQIDELEKSALMPLAMAVRPRAAVADVRAHLAEVAEDARKLATKLRALHNMPNMDSSGARALLEHGYWQRMSDDHGGMVAVVFVPRLDALTEAAAEAAKIKCKQTRPGTPSWREIDKIQCALWAGFADHYRSLGRRVPAYPAHLQPHAQSDLDFGQVVVTCCAAVGYDRFPKRAVEAFIKQRHQKRRELLR